jgi:hypothetical protein
MTPRQKFLNTLNFKKVEGKLVMVEWAAWWDKTIERWKQEGLPQELDTEGILDYFGFDKLICITVSGKDKEGPKPLSHGAGLIKDEQSYKELKKFLFTDNIIENTKRYALQLKERHEKGEIIVRLWLDGFFWFPRTILGIERHLYAFYDQPELMHRINKELAEFNIRVVEELFKILKPDMVGFAEDMSYNLGPMLSHDLFKEFLLPYYQQIIPHIKKHGVHILVDSDGDVTSMIPWFKEAGIDGVYPLERQAGVDLCKIREIYPDFLMLGGYDKMVMPLGEDAMRAEFERLLPVIKTGGYIPSVDHQTPPEVSFDNFKTYVRLFKEYCEKAVNEK